MAKTQSKRNHRSRVTVGVVSDRGRLRLSLPRALFSGRQRFISLGLEDSPENRTEAEAKALEISRYIKLNQFDFSLEKYKSPTCFRESRAKIEKPFPTLADIYQIYIYSARSGLAFFGILGYYRLCPQLA